jgi:hypothetical protein
MIKVNEASAKSECTGHRKWVYLRSEVDVYRLVSGYAHDQNRMGEIPK